MNRLIAVLGFSFGFLLAALSLGVAGGVSDPPISFYYPDHGWAAQSHAQGHDGYGPSNFPTWYGGTAKDGGENACQTNRYTNIQAAGSISTSSTVGTGDWPGGLVLQYVGCGVLPTSRTLFTTFKTSTGGGTPGYTYHTKASSSQCSGQGLSYPCGDWSTTSQIQISWWNQKTDTLRRMLLLHEWAHAWNLDDYCGSQTAMTKNGYAPCNWPSTPQYYQKDKDALWITYGY